MNNKKLTNILLYTLPAAAAVLNALPWCVGLRFAKGPEDYFIDYFSGFSLMPLGYGVWSHMLTGVCAVLLTVMGVLHARNEDPRLLRWMMSICIVGLLMGLTPLALGTSTAVSTMAALAVGAEAVILYRLREDQ